MKDYIEREQAVTVFKTFYGKSLRIMLDALEEEHAADVREVVRAKWEEVEVTWLADIEDQPDAIASMFCPECKRFANHVYHYGDPTYGMNFCPNCGADMRPEPPKEK